MRITEQQAQQMGIPPECRCGPFIPLPDGRTVSTIDRTDSDPHFLYCPLGDWLATRRALGAG